MVQLPNDVTPDVMIAYLTEGILSSVERMASLRSTPGKAFMHNCIIAQVGIDYINGTENIATPRINGIKKSHKSVYRYYYKQWKDRHGK